jgi:hypothetical protein
MARFELVIFYARWLAIMGNCCDSNTILLMQNQIATVRFALFCLTISIHILFKFDLGTKVIMPGIMICFYFLFNHDSI